MASYRSGRLVLCFVLLMVMQRVGSFMLKPLHRNGAFAGRALFSSTAATTPTTTTTQSLDPVSDTRAKETFNQVFASDKRPVILFDGVCNFCNGGIDTVLTLDYRRSFRYAPLQSDIGKDLLLSCGRERDDISSMVVVESNGKFHIKGDAAVRIIEEIEPAPIGKFTGSLIPKIVKDSLYDVIATNRYSILGKRDECRVRDPDDDRFLA